MWCEFVPADPVLHDAWLRPKEEVSLFLAVDQETLLSGSGAVINENPLDCNIHPVLSIDKIPYPKKYENHMTYTL